MSMIIITTESKDDERLRYQEICVFCYIATHLVDGVYKQANQYTANAALDGERKTAERTIKRLIEKGVIHGRAACGALKGRACSAASGVVQRVLAALLATKARCPAGAFCGGHFARDVQRGERRSVQREDS